MYYMYENTDHLDSQLFEQKWQESIFGYKSGWIPYLLKLKLAASASEPLLWHINMREALFKAERRHYALIVDIAPKNKKQPYIAELVNVWGYSSDEWTPLLFHLNQVELQNNDIKTIRLNQNENPFYTHAYAQGSVASGELTGTWNAAPPSSTNGAVLYPPVLKYFYECIIQQKHIEFKA